MKKWFVLALLLLGLCATPCQASELDTSGLRSGLPEEASQILDQVSPESGDVKGGFSALWQGAVSQLRAGLKKSVQSAFLIVAVCMLVSMLQSFAKSSGMEVSPRVVSLTASTAILLLSYQNSGSLIAQCKTVLGNLDTFTKLLTTAFAAASAIAGKPASAVTTAGATLLFSNVIISLSVHLFLPMLTCYLILIYAGVACESPLLLQTAKLGKWGLSTFFKIFLTAYFAYLSFTGLVSGSADTAAVKAAQTLTSSVPLVGGVISSASGALLGGAAVLRSGIGFFGFLGALAICLTPFVQGVCHLLMFKTLSAFASAYADGGVQTLLDGLSNVYSMLLGILAACCTVQFLSIVVSMTVCAV